MRDSDDILLRDPIIIIGAPRSGTTLLGEVLQHHPDLAYVEEPRLTWRIGNDTKSDMLRPRDARPEVCRQIRSAFADLMHAKHRMRLLEKTPSNSLRMGFVDTIFPDCRFVHILRNGIDSVLSIRWYWLDQSNGINPVKLSQRLKEINWKQIPHYAKEFLQRVMPEATAPVLGRKVWGPRIPAIDSLLLDLDLLEVCCLQWRMCVEAACHYGRRLPAHRYMEVRLEDMSPGTMRALFDFCGLRDDPTVIAKFNKQFDPALAGARRARAEGSDVDQILQWIEPTMRWLGYL